MKKTIFSLLIFPSFFLLCFTNGSSQKSSHGKLKTHLPAKKNTVKYGTASYYARKFAGRKTSDGSAYNSARLTAACNVLPLGTRVKVTNLRNNRSVVVLINDHLHHKNKRLIDLSKSAAQRLGFISRGITRVKVEVLSKPKKRRVKS